MATSYSSRLLACSSAPISGKTFLMSSPTLGFELVKQNRFAKISEHRKEKGLLQGENLWIFELFYEKCEEFAN